MLDENRRWPGQDPKKFPTFGYGKKKKKNAIALPYHVICANNFNDKFLNTETFISEDCIHILTSKHQKIKASGAALAPERLSACPSMVTRTDLPY